MQGPWFPKKAVKRDDEGIGSLSYYDGNIPVEVAEKDRLTTTYRKVFNGKYPVLAARENADTFKPFELPEGSTHDPVFSNVKKTCRLGLDENAVNAIMERKAKNQNKSHEEIFPLESLASRIEETFPRNRNYGIPNASPAIFYKANGKIPSI